MSIVCIICSDPITAASDVYSTPCGHIFHFLCLCYWMERSKTCPHCRQKTSNELNHRVFPIFAENAEDEMELVKTTKLKINEKMKINLENKVNRVKMQNKRLKNDNASLNEENAGLKLEVADLKRKELDAQSEIRSFKNQNSELGRKLKNFEKLEGVVDLIVVKLNWENLSPKEVHWQVEEALKSVFENDGTGQNADMETKVRKIIKESASEEKKVYVASDDVEATPEPKRKRALREIDMNVPASSPEAGKKMLRKSTRPRRPTSKYGNSVLV